MKTTTWQISTGTNPQTFGAATSADSLPVGTWVGLGRLRSHASPTPYPYYVHCREATPCYASLLSIHFHSLLFVTLPPPRSPLPPSRQHQRIWLSGGAYLGVKSPGSDHSLGTTADSRTNSYGKPEKGRQKSGAANVLGVPESQMSHQWGVARSLSGKTAYVDLWWSRDGKNWYETTYVEGVGQSLYSTAECFKTEVDMEPIYLGKYGHKLLQFQRPAVKPGAADVNGLYVIAGHTVDGGTSVSDVFVDGPGLHCNTGGKSCSGHGTCLKAKDFGGCACVDGSTVRTVSSFEFG